MLDKDIDGVIGHLKGVVDHWCVTDLPLPRAASSEQIQEKLLAAGIAPSDKAGEERSINLFATPADAYANAMSRAGENDRIVVFGSFLTVAGVMAARKH
jgi:dihydrofolate synthase/folylpolyglutamate synthase